MKFCVTRVVLLSFALAACGGAPAPAPGGQLTGAAAPRLAVEQFLAAARAQDLQAMSMVWGTDKGPARDVVDRAQLEKRELIMMCYLSHDKFAIASDVATKGSQHDVQVQLNKGTMTRDTRMVVVRGPSDRWYVMDVNLEPLRDLCSGKPGR